MDNSRKYCEALAETDVEKRGPAEARPYTLWRITCFVVHKKFRRKGVGSAALRAALEAIRRKGGGAVEGYPITRWKPGTFGNESTHGTASMFEKEGFEKVAELGGTRFSTHVLMRRRV
jgi:GNAT superfamily N-acetyltransferase